MKKKSIAILSPSFCKNKTLVKEFSHRFADFKTTFNFSGSEYDYSSTNAALIDVDYAIVGKGPINRETLTRANLLRGIAKYGVGLDNISFEACAERKIDIEFEPGVNAEAVAEHTIGLMLSACRNIAQNHHLICSGEWIKDGGFQFSHSTIGIIGLGRVGTKVAKLAKAFGCEVQFHDIEDRSHVAKELDIKPCNINELLRLSDIVTIHTPLTELTRGMGNDAFFKQMKQGSILVNTSRGEILDIEGLKKVVQIGKLRAAALDVFPKEPIDIGDSLRESPGFTLTPHTAGNSVEAVLAMGRSAMKSLDTLIAKSKS